MTSTKALTYLHLLDAARCNADWDSVPEYVRKVNKHAGAARKCLTQTALLDHDLCPSRISHTLHKNSTIVASSSALSRASITPGGTTSVSSSTLVSLTQLAKLLEDEIARFKVENANAAAAAADEAANPKASKKKSKTPVHIVTSEEDIYQAEVTLAYLHYLLKAPRVVLQILPQDAPEGDVVSQEWTRVCTVKALCLRGLCLESLGRKVEALLVYRSLPLPDLTRGAGGAVEAGGEASYWTRKALARFAVLSWEVFRGDYGPSTEHGEEENDVVEDEDTIDEVKETDGAREGLESVREEDDLELAREKQLQQSYHLDEGQLLGAFRAYHAFSTSLSNLRPNTAASSTSLMTLSASKVNKEEETSRREIYKTYLHVVSTLIKDAASRNDAISTDMQFEVQAVEDIYESLLLKATNFPRADAVNEEVLNWVDTVVANWENTGEKGDDAQRVVEILYRAAQKTFHSPRILRHLFVTLAAAGNFNDSLLSLNTYITLVLADKARLAKGGPPNPDAHDFDPDNIILATCVAGVRFLVKHFNDKAARGMEIAALIKGWIFEWQVEDQHTLSQVWRGIGLAAAASARQTVESSQRTELQERAVASFRKSLEYIPDRVDILFDLAMALAEVREIDEAVAAVRLVVEHQEKCIPAWHLLALLLTARQEWDTAFNVTEAIFSIFDEDGKLDIGVGGKEGLLEVKITQMAIVEVVEGPEAAVNLADELLRLYTRLFPGAIQANGTGTTSKEGTVPSTPKTPVPGLTTPGRGRPTTSATQHTAAPTIEVTTEKGHRKRSRSTKRSRASSMPGTVRRKGKDQGEEVPPPPRRSVEEGDVSLSASMVSQREGEGEADDAMAFSFEEVTNPSVEQTPHASPQPTPESTPQKHTPNKLHRMNTKGSTKSGKEGGSLRGRKSQQLPPAKIDTTDTKHIGEREYEHEHHHHHHHHHHQRSKSEHTIDGSGGLEGESYQDISMEKAPHPIQEVADDRPLLPRPFYLREPVLGEREEKARIKAALLRIWLVISGLYRRSGMWDDANVAVEEATGLSGAEDADVLAERGFLAAAQEQHLQASNFYESALAYEPDHPLATIGLARQLLSVKTETIAARDRASGLLSSLTKLGAGWDMSEAWFELAECYEQAGQTGKAKEVLWWVVKLEDTRPVRAWKNIRPRVL